MRTPNPKHLKRMMTLFSSSPVFSLLNMVIREVTPDSSLVTMDLETKHHHPFGYVHGGIIATIIDTAAFWAVYYSLEDETAGLISIDLKLNFLAPVSFGRLDARGRKIKLGGRLGYSSVEVVDEDGVLIAHGTSTLMVLPGKAYSLDPPVPSKFLD
jgi:uncharacterized protein (TIGR00369 family)